ncbi:MFS general substrate transporter [Desarmillaria tabescens]|uniref:MFS general substrate transporter n=1 Tax=Armillaria tabescens TaxID=1929756 RepID=A0AA39K0N4_ARMTA|nr:MFS general substrate transporter [Desarmillaria tabescens]KAK0451226.1 MFS general substrate transporter [Desarmillaria tabescens]
MPSPAPSKERQLHLENVSSPTDLESQAPRVADGDAALAILGDKTVHKEITPEENKRVLRKIDWWLMPVILLVYFLQQLDKSSLSYTSVFGIVAETGLVGRQYSWLSSIVYIAQLVWQPASSYFLVKLPIAKYLFVNVFLWGAAVACTAAAHDFKGLLAGRFFLGIFEATVAPCFMTITQMWWRRRQQTMRLSMWMAMNGGTGMVGSLLSWGLGHIGGKLHTYQTIFLFIGLLTLVCSPVVLFVLPDSPTKARFLNQEEKVIAIERLRANNQGTETKVWKWGQVLEVFLDLKTYLWFSLLFLCAFSYVTSEGFGFDSFNTILFNIPFNALQVIVTLLAAEISTRLRLKWPVVFALTLPPIAGASALYTLGRGVEYRNSLLGCYYVLSFFTALQPMLYTWSSQNTAGHTKKLCNTGIIFVAQCAGNIVGPLLYTTDQKPYYHRGLIAKCVVIVLKMSTWYFANSCDSIICWILLSVLTLITAAYLAFLNRGQAAKRRQMGKAENVTDKSLQKNDEYDVNEDNEGEARNDKS